MLWVLLVTGAVLVASVAVRLVLDRTLFGLRLYIRWLNKYRPAGRTR
ncbi:hypothetical protein [Amycolatopsis minnesotensis]|uniref:Uncharacterized protein n=1 Tax=Amycolatopsis minnesotensis TaxID=337894 RepID=A0ABP5E3N1_9PSEU